MGHHRSFKRQALVTGEKKTEGTKINIPLIIPSSSGTFMSVLLSRDALIWKFMAGIVHVNIFYQFIGGF